MRRRPVLWLLLAAFLLLVGVAPSIASVIGGTLGLVFAGALELLAQPPVLGLALVLLVFASFRRKPSRRVGAH